MKLNLLLHVGVHKTGTTSIQSFLILNNEILKKHGIYFPKKHCTIENKPVMLRQAIEKGDRKSYEKILEEIIFEAKNNNCHTVIFSDEDFQKFAHTGNNNIGELKKFFNIKVVMYIRRQDRYSESAYGFWVQWYRKRTTVEPRNLLRLFPMINYDNLLKRWENLFGFSNIILRVYDDVVLTSGLIKDVVSILDVDGETNWVYPPKASSNITLNKYILEFLRRTNHIPLLENEFEKLKLFLVNTSSIKDGPKAIFLGDIQRGNLLRESRTSNTLVAKRYFNTDKLFPEEIPKEVANSLTNDSFYNVVLELERDENLNEIITKKIISLNIEALRDVIVRERKKHKNYNLTEYLKN